MAKALRAWRHANPSHSCSIQTVMTPGNRRFVKTAFALLGLMALATAVLWIALFMFVKPARGDTIDPRMLYVIDGDTLALAGERIRLLGIDAPETRDARCERNAVDRDQRRQLVHGERDRQLRGETRNGPGGLEAPAAARVQAGPEPADGLLRAGDREPGPG